MRINRWHLVADRMDVTQETKEFINTLALRVNVLAFLRLVYFRY